MKKEVDIFIPCFIDQVYPETGFNMIKILEHLGVRVYYNENQSCCGQIAYNSGFWDDAKSLGEKFIHDFLINDRIVVSPSASCASMVKNGYRNLFHNSALHNKYQQLRKNIIEFSDYLVNHLDVEDIGAELNAKVTYHHSCSSGSGYGLHDEVIRLINGIKGVEYVEMNAMDECCGFGGTFAVKHHNISAAMAEKKIENAILTGADYIISADSSCLMHLEGYIKKHSLEIKTLHIIDLLAKGIS